MDIKETVRIATDLCYRVAAVELQGRTLRIVPHKIVPTILAADVRDLGCTASFDLSGSHSVEDWNGQRDPVIALGYVDIEGALPPRTANRIVGAVLHGLAHYIECPAGAKHRAFPREILTVADLASPALSRRQGVTPPWSKHSGRFMRVAYHLQQRARKLGYDILPREVFAAEKFGFSQAQDYAIALQAEAGSGLNCDFRTICASPFPWSFSKVFQRDKRLWLSSVSNRKGFPNDFDITT